jgi:3-isopropylmalate/(R)-2-methylmalate dehydratase large subunit/methanogen homoaconitase large subunit
VTFEIVRRIGVDGANYCSIEYTGEMVEQMSVSERFTLCNMAIEMGGKAGLVAPDTTTQAWLRGRTDQEYPMLATNNPRYEQIVEIDALQLQPMIACPPDVNNVVTVEKASMWRIDQVFLGTVKWTPDDLAIAANILRGKTIHPQTYGRYSCPSRVYPRPCGWATWKPCTGRCVGRYSRWPLLVVIPGVRP